MRQRIKDREEAIRNMIKLEIAPHDQVKLLRLGAILHRLAEAQCNGDWPADNGERRTVECGAVRTVGHGCGLFWVPSVLRKTRGYLCPDCCASEDARKIAGEYGLQAIIQGDPRGAVLSLAPKDASREDIDSGRVRGLYVR